MKRWLAVAVLVLAFASVGFAQHHETKHNLRAAATAHSVALTWTASTVPTGAPAVTSVNVSRGATSGGETLLANVVIASLTCPSGSPTTSQCYTDTTVTAGTTYFYIVASVNSAGTSPSSNEITATIPNSVVPNAPTGLTGTAK